jgi:hypothetical protein
MALTFGIDYDETITENFDLFGSIIKSIEDSGNQAVIVTGRSKIGAWETEVLDTVDYLINKFNIKNIPVVFSGSQWKKEAAKEAGYTINIWIDNSPEYIGKQYILSGLHIGEKNNHLSPETSGRIKKAMEDTLKSAWESKSEELKIYPKRLKDGPEKDKLWEKINKEANDIIQDYTK